MPKTDQPPLKPVVHYSGNGTKRDRHGVRLWVVMHLNVHPYSARLSLNHPPRRPPQCEPSPWPWQANCFRIICEAQFSSTRPRPSVFGIVLSYSRVVVVDGWHAERKLPRLYRSCPRPKAESPEGGLFYENSLMRDIDVLLWLWFVNRFLGNSEWLINEWFIKNLLYQKFSNNN